MAAWRRRARRLAGAPEAARPARGTLCVTLPGLEAAPHDAIGLEWFRDAAHLDRFEAWLGEQPGGDTAVGLDATVDPERSPLVVADEHVRRGGAWLARRWRDGGPRLKHLAVAVRAEGLGAAAFAERWRLHAGTAGALVVPDDVRGRAYVQNPARPDAGESGYDALGEVYVDDRAGLVRRIEWFRANVGDGDVAELVGRRWFVAAEEVAVWEDGAGTTSGER